MGLGAAIAVLAVSCLPVYPDQAQAHRRYWSVGSRVIGHAGFFRGFGLSYHNKEAIVFTIDP